MNILIVSQYFWPEEFRINDVARNMVERGHRVTVLTGIPNYPKGRFFKGYGYFDNLRQEVDGVKIIRVPLLPRRDGSGVHLSLNYLSYAFTGTFSAPFVCREDYDVILVCQLSPVTSAIPALALRRLNDIPVILWVLDLWPESLSATGAVKSSKILNMVDKLVRFIYTRSDLIAVASPGFTRSIVAKGIPEEKIRDFPNWYEPEFSIQTSTSEHKILDRRDDEFVVLFAGNIGEAQGFDTVLDAAGQLKEHSDIRWVVLGEGRKFSWLKKEVKDRGLEEHMSLLGRRPTSEMPDYFSCADALLVTLRPDPVLALTIPGKIQSYMTSGKPIVAALDGEGHDLIRSSGSGMVCAAGDAEGLASRVLELRGKNPEERDKMGEYGRKYCRDHFDRELLLDCMERWMKELSSRCVEQDLS